MAFAGDKVNALSDGYVTQSKHAHDVDLIRDSLTGPRT